MTNILSMITWIQLNYSSKWKYTATTFSDTFEPIFLVIYSQITQNIYFLLYLLITPKLNNQHVQKALFLYVEYTKLQ